MTTYENSFTKTLFKLNYNSCSSIISIINYNFSKSKYIDKHKTILKLHDTFRHSIHIIGIIQNKNTQAVLGVIIVY